MRLPRSSRFGRLLRPLGVRVQRHPRLTVGFLLADRVFKVPFDANPLVWVYGVAGGAIAVVIAGWLGTRNIVRQPTLAVLRQLG